MSLWGFRFFGLTSVSKEELYLEEIWNVMMAYGKMSYWDVYSLPIPIRKWLIRRYNKHSQEQDSKGEPRSDKPLTEQQRREMIKKTQISQAQPNSLKSYDFLKSTRNRK